MRNPDRLFDFYKAMTCLHKKYCPDWRFGQLMMNFFYWLQTEKKIDPFFPEEDRMLELLKEFYGEGAQSPE